MLINRLGDQSKRLGSKVVMYLDILLQKHPHWKEVIAREVKFPQEFFLVCIYAANFGLMSDSLRFALTFMPLHCPKFAAFGSIV